MTTEECNELCSLFDAIQVRVADNNSSNLIKFCAIHNSFVYESCMSNKD